MFHVCYIVFIRFWMRVMNWSRSRVYVGGGGVVGRLSDGAAWEDGLRGVVCQSWQAVFLVLWEHVRTCDIWVVLA
jgi:hypothetical protein